MKSILEKNENLTMIDDWFWTKEDIPALEYLKKSHKGQMEAMFPFLEDTNTVVQAGGHCGFVIRNLLDYFDTIYTFEPDNTMFLALCLNVPETNVYKFQSCVGVLNKTVGMVNNEIHPGSGAKYVNGDGKIPIIRIDDLGLSRCDLIMLDTEGYEYHAVMGAKNTIKKYHPVLCLERYWGPRTLNIHEGVFDDYLKELGYESVARAGESDYIYKWMG